MNLAEKKDVANDKEEIPAFKKLSHLYHTISIDEVLTLTSEALALLIYIRALRQMGKTCFASNGFLSKEFGCSSRKIQLAINELVDRKRVERKTVQGVRFLIEIPVIREIAERGGEQIFTGGEQPLTGGENSFMGGEQIFTGGVNNPSRGGEQIFTHKNNIINTKEDKKEEREEGSSTPSPSAPLSEFEFCDMYPHVAEMETTEVGSKTELTSQSLQTLVEQMVAKELQKSARNGDKSLSHAMTLTTPVKTQEGGEMEASGASVPVVSKRRAPATVRPPQLPIDQDLPEEEMKAVLHRFKEWLPNLNLKPEFHTEDFLGATGQWICARQRKYLQRVEYFKDAPPTFNAIKLQLTSIQREGYNNALATVRDAATFEYKNLEYRPGKTGKSGAPMKSFKDQEREKGKEWLNEFINKGTFSFDLGGMFKNEEA